MKNHLLKLLVVTVAAFIMAGCEKEGSAEKAGKAIDNAFEQAKEKLEDAGK